MSERQIGKTKCAWVCVCKCFRTREWVWEWEEERESKMLSRALNRFPSSPARAEILRQFCFFVCSKFHVIPVFQPKYFVCHIFVPRFFVCLHRDKVVALKHPQDLKLQPTAFKRLSSKGSTNFLSRYCLCVTSLTYTFAFSSTATASYYEKVVLFELTTEAGDFAHC